ncbi:MAG: hypothetical protein ACI9CF_001344 [Candidatus Omnitrophota bacterium]|jgi:hypothetical protein
MAESTSEKKLKAVRERLKMLNQRVRRDAGANNPHRLAQISSSRIRNRGASSLEEMRDKLRTINSVLRKKLDGEEITPEDLVVKATPKPKPMAKAVSSATEIELTEEVLEEVSSKQAEKTSDFALPDQGDKTSSDTAERIGVGLDLGTAYLTGAREKNGSKVFVKHERNAFLSVRGDPSTVSLLNRLKIRYVEMGENMFVLGSVALDLGNIFNREIKRTMSMGILNPSEAAGIPVIKLLIEHILWEPRVKDEICCFSIPAKPVDRDQDTIYHKGVFEALLKSIGFKPMVIDEGYAVVLSEMASSEFTGIGVSCGGGMVNACAAFKSMPVLSFSITRGGDWIDTKASEVLGIPKGQVTIAKESGINIQKPEGREADAIAIYYRNYIHYFLEQLSEVFASSKDKPDYRDPVEIVFAGGSSMVNGFLEVVKEELLTIDMGFEIGTVRRAEEPFTSVARGCLFHAINSGNNK